MASDTIAAAIALTCLMVSAHYVRIPSSYWFDELWSVAASSQGPAALHHLLLTDVHPPLYQTLLSGWLALFGDSEPATRLLSWLAYSTAAAVLFLSLRSTDPLFATYSATFLLANQPAMYYSNETRSYSLALLFASVVATRLPRACTHQSPLFVVGCILLSLTHYFGLLTAGVALAVALLASQRRRAVLCLTGLACLAWPVYHALSGELLAHTGGNFWIKVNGPLDTARLMATCYLPPQCGIFSGLGLLVALAACGWMAGRSLSTDRGAKESAVAFGVTVSTAVVAGLLTLVAVVDMWSPMSTTRNYIVTVPFVSMMAGGVASMAASNAPRLRWLVAPTFFSYCVGYALLAPTVLERKAFHGQDWKGAAAVLIANAGGSVLLHASKARSVERDLICNFYVRKLSGGKVATTQWLVDEEPTSLPALVLVGMNSLAGDDSIARIEARGGRLVPTRSTPDSVRHGNDVGVFLIAEPAGSP